MAKKKISRSCADHQCGCVYCTCGAMLGAAISFKTPQSYARFGSDCVTAYGYRLPPSDMAPSIVRDDWLDELPTVRAPDNALAGLALMWMIGRFATCSLAVPDAKK